MGATVPGCGCGGYRPGPAPGPGPCRPGPSPPGPAGSGSRRAGGCPEGPRSPGAATGAGAAAGPGAGAAMAPGARSPRPGPRTDHGADDRAAGHLQVDGTEPDDQQDGPPLVGLEDRVDARLEPGGDQGLDAGDGQFLVLRIGQVDDLGHEVAAVDHLVEVLGGELDRDRVVGEVGVGGRGGRGDLDRGIEGHALDGRGCSSASAGRYSPG